MTTSKQQLDSLYKVTTLVYLLQLIALFTAFPLVIAVIINYFNLDSVRGTWLESHFRWQIRTFWFSLLWYVTGAVLLILLVGYVIWGIVWLWQIYRVIRGWHRLSQHREMYS